MSRAQSLFCVALMALVLLCSEASAQATSSPPSLAGAGAPLGPDGVLADGTTFSDPDCAIESGRVICVASGGLSMGYGPVQQIEALDYPPPYSPTAGRWQHSGGAIRGGPSIVTVPDSDDRVIFVRGTDNHLWRKIYYDAHTWTDYVQLTPVISSDPDCLAHTQWPVGTLLVCAALSPSGSVLVIVYNGATTTQTDLGGQFYHAPTIAMAGNVIHVWAVTAAGGMQTRSLQSNWTALPGQYTSAPDCTTGGPHSFDCFARGTDGGLWHTYEESGWKYESWGGQFPGGPAVTAQMGYMFVHVRGSDDRLWCRYYSSSAGELSPWYRAEWLSSIFLPALQRQ